jgi:hypothetical protein
MAVAIFVDDILIIDNNNELRERFLQHLKKSLKIDKFDKIHHMLGMKITHTEDQVKISQEHYIDSILEKYNMKDCKPVNSPISTTNEPIDETPADKELYMKIIGSLNYLSIISRPDIAYAVSYFSRFMTNPFKTHFIGLKRILRYLKGTKNYEIAYSRSGNQNLIGYSDASFGGDQLDRRSQSGHIFMLAGASIYWRSHRQQRIAKSSTEAEIMSASTAISEAIYITKILKDLDMEQTEAPILYQDNQPAIQLQLGTGATKRSKHYDIDFHYIRQYTEEKSINITYLQTDQMIADVLTKPPKVQYLKRFQTNIFGSQI